MQAWVVPCAKILFQFVFVEMVSPSFSQDCTLAAVPGGDSDQTCRNISLYYLRFLNPTLVRERPVFIPETTGNSFCFTVCFTVCLFISPDLDGYRAPQMRH